MDAKELEQRLAELDAMPNLLPKVREIRRQALLDDFRMVQHARERFGPICEAMNLHLRDHDTSHDMKESANNGATRASRESPKYCLFSLC